MSIHRLALPAASRTFGKKRDLGRLQFRRVTRPEHVKDLVDNSVRVKPSLGIHGWRAVMIDEDIRQYHAADLEADAFERASITEQLHYVGTEAANGTFLDRDEQFMFARQPQDELSIERLCKACISDGGRNAVRR